MAKKEAKFEKVGVKSVRSSGGARKLVNADGSAWDGPLGGPVNVVRKPGRPPSAPGTAATMAIPLEALRALRLSLLAASTAPRAADTVKSVDDSLSWITKKLGPAIDPDYKPTKQRTMVHYLVREVGGTETTFTNALAASLAYGCGVSSLKNMLSRGQGKCGKTVTVHGQEWRVTCEKVEVLADIDER